MRIPTMRPFKLVELNYAQVKEMQFEVAVLPMGATEPHNLHLPYGTDWYEGTTVGEHICRRATELGGKVVLLPTMPYGTETNQMEFPLAMNVMPSTLGQVITDLVASLAKHGIHKVMLLNSHGGNDFKPLLRELHGQFGSQLFLCNWYQVATDKYFEIFDNKDDHGGEMETSVMLAYYPQLVAKNADGSLAADDGAVRPTRFAAVNQGWVQITRPWHLLTTNSGSGNPHKSTAEKGKQLMEIIAERVGTFLAELSAAPIDKQFPF
jgi:creatinine amidohydrolase